MYRNVWENRDVLEGKNFILFPMGNYIGKDNSFDVKMPLEDLCNMEEIEELVSMGGILGWHTWSHRNLTKLSEEEIIKEIDAPFKTELFAYPYGRLNDRVIKLLKERGYKYAFSAGKFGDGTDFQLKRTYLVGNNS